MNPWADFVVTVLVRFVCGVLLGALACLIFGFRVVMRAIAEDGFPIERFLIWGAIGGVICIFTTPREMWPWTKA
jgi:hypothetical protein